MAPGNNALKYCSCCKQFVTKRAELTHRRAMFSHPYASARPESSKAVIDLNSVFKSTSLKLPSTTHSHSTATDSQMSGANGPTMGDSMDIGYGNPEDAIEEAQNTSMPNFPSLHVRTVSAAQVQDDDDDDGDDINDDESEIPLQDSEQPDDETSHSDIVDWEALEVELASMDTSGQSYYAVHAAEVGAFLILPLYFLISDYQ
jgi:hypothetical protein